MFSLWFESVETFLYYTWIYVFGVCSLTTTTKNKVTPFPMIISVIRSERVVEVNEDVSLLLSN